MAQQNVVKQNKDIILYFIQQMGVIEGRKKVMKLMFILEHFDFKKNKVVTENRVGKQFEIYDYGVYNDSIMKTMLEIIQDKSHLPLDTDHLKKEYQNYTPQINTNLETRINQTIEKFGHYSGLALEVTTLNMIGLDPTNKGAYHRQSVKDVMKARKEKMDWENSTGW